jgi:hypothetical protein
VLSESYIRLERWFVRFVVVILFASAIAKLITVSFGAELLARGDPIIRLPYFLIFPATAATELYLAIRLVRESDRLLSYWLLAAFTFILLSYRIALTFAIPGKGCPCLGVVRSWLPGGNDAQGLLDYGLLLAAAVMLGGCLLFGIKLYRKQCYHTSTHEHPA